MIDLQDFLAEHFGIKQTSSLYRSFSKNSLKQPFFLNPNRTIKRNLDYEPPTPDDLGHFRSITNYSSGDLGRRFHLDSRSVSRMVSERAYERGHYFPHHIWMHLLESAAIIERFTLKPKFADIREEVLRTSQSLPTKHELYVLIGLSGLSIEQTAAASGIAESVLLNAALRGTTVIDENLQYVEANNNATASQTVIHSPIAPITIEQWQAIRTALGISGTGYITHPPKIRSVTLSHEFGDYSPYAKDRKKDTHHQRTNDKDPLHAIKDFYPQDLMTGEGDNHDNDRLAVPTYDKEQPYFEICRDIYQPPEPMELRAIMFWSGYSVGELAMIMGMQERELRFLSSVNAINYKPKSRDRIDKPGKTRYIRFDHWRRFVEVFNLAPQKQIRRARPEDI